MNVQDFMSRVDTSGSCWIWTGSRTRQGYGNLRFDGGWDYAHRVSYRLRIGPIAEGMVIDHLCRNRACVNPAHLDAVTQGENNRRGLIPYGVIRTTCKHGHDITRPENVYTAPRGDNRCRVCAREQEDRRRLRRQEARLAR